MNCKKMCEKKKILKNLFALRCFKDCKFEREMLIIIFYKFTHFS